MESTIKYFNPLEIKSLANLKKIYRKLAQQYHPDKITNDIEKKKEYEGIIKVINNEKEALIALYEKDGNFDNAIFEFYNDDLDVDSVFSEYNNSEYNNIDNNTEKREYTKRHNNIDLLNIDISITAHIVILIILGIIISFKGIIGFSGIVIGIFYYSILDNNYMLGKNIDYIITLFSAYLFYTYIIPFLG